MSGSSEQNRTFTKHEAIELMRQGKKITHTHFNAEEWMTIEDNNTIVLEDGVRSSLIDFFSYRYLDSWDDGYTIFISKE